jgi:molecular chaperone DnaK (HSP70)
VIATSGDAHLGEDDFDNVIVDWLVDPLTHTLNPYPYNPYPLNPYPLTRTHIKVIATSGDAHLGGDDFDNVIVDWLVEQYSLQHDIQVFHVSD